MKRVYHTNGNLAVELVDDAGELITALSVNMPACFHVIGETEFFEKTWNENAEIARAALASGVLVDTKRTSGDVVNAPIWTF
jgi:hypothetical protein